MTLEEWNMRLLAHIQTARALKQGVLKRQPSELEVNAGRLRAVRLGKKIRFLPKDIQRWMDANATLPAWEGSK